MAGPHTLTFTDANFSQEVLQSEHPVLVDFWAPWCGPCMRLGPAIDGVATTYAGKIKVGKINIDDNQEMATRYGIASIPALLVFKGGEVVAKMVGLQPEANIAKALDKQL